MHANQAIYSYDNANLTEEYVSIFEKRNRMKNLRNKVSRKEIKTRNLFPIENGTKTFNVDELGMKWNTFPNDASACSGEYKWLNEERQREEQKIPICYN